MAAYIPDEKITAIKNASDIVDIVSETVSLRRAGRNLLGLCPFHAEKTPSFTVSPDKQIFYCFGCGAGGNVFSFLMKHSGLTFPEVARSLAGRYGIDLPTRNLSPHEKKKLTERETILTLNGDAVSFYQGCLLKTSTMCLNRSTSPLAGHSSRRCRSTPLAVAFVLQKVSCNPEFIGLAR